MRSSPWPVVILVVIILLRLDRQVNRATVIGASGICCFALMYIAAFKWRAPKIPIWVREAALWLTLICLTYTGWAPEPPTLLFSPHSSGE